MIAKLILLAVSGLIICVSPISYVSGYFIGPIQWCKTAPGGDPNTNPEFCCKPYNKCDKDGKNCELVKQCYDCTTDKNGKENCLCFMNCEGDRMGLLKDKTDFGGLVNELPEPPTKGSPDANIDKNSGVMIDRNTSGITGNTSSTAPNFTINKNSIGLNTMDKQVTKNGVLK